jgi:hypothetical protein
MTTEIQNTEHQVLSLAQNLLNVLADVDQEIGRRAVLTAFMAKGWVAHDFQTKSEASVSPDGVPRRAQPAVAFFDRGEPLKPAENALLCCAYHYAQYGSQAFSLDQVRDIARDAGLVLPDRVDMTLKGAGKDGKKYFQPAGKGSFKFTSHGELYVQGRWEVRPGNASRIPKGKH